MKLKKVTTIGSTLAKSLSCILTNIISETIYR